MKINSEKVVWLESEEKAEARINQDTVLKDKLIKN